MKTIRETFTHFLAQKKAENLSQKTLDNYLYSLQVFLTDNGLDDLEGIDYFTPLHIAQWVQYQQKETSRNNISINHFLRDIRVYINFLVTFYNLPRCPVKLLKVAQPVIPRYSQKALETLLEAPRATDIYPVWRTWLIINIMLATGARIGSVCRLKKEDITDTTITFTHTKSGKEHILPLSPTLKLNLIRFNNQWETDSEYLLISAKNGDELTPTGAYQSLQDYCKARGVECLGWHCFRHTFAYNCYKEGIDIVTLQHYLQHSSIELTRHYIGLLGANDLPQVKVPLDCLCKGKKHIRKK